MGQPALSGSKCFVGVPCTAAAPYQATVYDTTGWKP